MPEHESNTKRAGGGGGWVWAWAWASGAMECGSLGRIGLRKVASGAYSSCQTQCTEYL